MALLGTRVLSRSDVVPQGQRRIDERDMAQRLREIAQHAPGTEIVFFRQKADIVAAFQKPFEQVHRAGAVAHQHVIVHEPEAAGQKCSLARREAVHATGRFVSLHQAPGD